MPIIKRSKPHAIPPSWYAYRRLHRIASFGMLGLPAVVVVAALCVLVYPALAEPLFLVLAPVWALWWGQTAFRLVRWPCPRCGQAWLAQQESGLCTHRRCARCGLALYESP